MAASAFIVQVSCVVAFLFAKTTVAGSNASASINATAMALRRSTEALPAAAAAHNGSHQYTCYLCHKSRSLMIRRCPIAQDDCHVACVTLPTPSRPPSPPRGVAAPSGGGGGRDADDCYVMKAYPDGSWVVVDVVGCRATAAACYLACGNGDDEHGAGGVATPRGPLPHGLPEFQLCGDHLTARGGAVAGV
ncbi:uncharacterized protein [Setaria viridis]|uniref:Uncharacterized protein n=1 Tax=Setaria viridis TaxID=4556 RepID=A0A4U6TA63_SETVI|nr:uncharacterized protein LOC117835777 [Setaria viridis]TKV97222.1 hypothetical protein SEVIR_9G480300v2 [Setaria viridis]